MMIDKEKAVSDNLLEQNRTEQNWINSAKFVAIIGVLIDHCLNITYADLSIQQCSFYSVSLFIIISGYLSYSSNSRKNYTYSQWIVHSLKKIFLSYIVATCVYQIAGFHYFSLSDYIKLLINFNATAPLYYVLLYIMLMLAAYPLCKLLASFEAKNQLRDEIFLGAAIVIFAWFSTNCTDILGVYGGGGKLFGGTYLILFYLGMLLNKYKVFVYGNKKKYIRYFVVGLIGYVLMMWIIGYDKMREIDEMLPFGAGINPPSLTLSLMAVFVLFFCYGFFNLLTMHSITNCIAFGIGCIGKHTLYIFMYHMLVLNNLIPFFSGIPMGVFKTILCLVILIAGSIMIEYIFNMINSDLKKRLQ